MATVDQQLSVSRRAIIAAVISVFHYNRQTSLVRSIITATSIVGIAALGLLTLGWQIDFTDLRAHGVALNLWQRFFANGSTWATMWPGWTASIAFTLAILRLQRGPTDPPLGHSPTQHWTVGELRSGLRHEYHLTAIPLLPLGVLAIFEISRWIIYIVAALRGVIVAQNSLVALSLECLGFVSAFLLLVVWTVNFKKLLDRWGAAP